MNYSANVKFASKELSARDRLFVKNFTDAVQLDEATADGALVIEPAYYAIVEVHNEKSSSRDYDKYVVVDTSGVKYVTGSESFFKSFVEIAEEMKDETEAYSINVFRAASKNYAGKSFITCSIV